MSRFIPGSELYILANVSCDKGYNHSFRFNDRDEQTSYFSNKAVYKLSAGTNDFSYFRQNNTIRVNKSPEELNFCNYLMFKNTEFYNTVGDFQMVKWIYAFIDSVEYANNGCAEIYFTVDVLQTFYFDFEFGKCFIERQHSITDVPGDNVVPEPVNYGDFTAVNEVVSGSETVGTGTRATKWLAGLVMNKVFPRHGTFSPTGGYNVEYTGLLNRSAEFGFSLYIQRPTPDFGSPNYDTSSAEPIVWNHNPVEGIPTSLYWYMDIPVDNNPNYYPLPYSNAFIDYSQVEKLTAYGFNSHVYNSRTYTEGSGASYIAGELNLMTLIDFICRGFIEGLDENNIEGVFIYPAQASATGNTQNATLLGFLRGISAKSVELPLTNRFVDKSRVYTAANKKLLTAPFTYVKTINGNGGSASYKFEDSDNLSAGERAFKAYQIMSIAGQYTAQLVPRNYENVAMNFEQGLIQGDLPLPSYKGSRLAEYLTENRGKIASTLLGSAINTIGGIFSSQITASNMTAIGHITTTTQKTRNDLTGRMIKTNQLIEESKSTGEYAPNYTVPVESAAKTVGGIIGQAVDLKNAPPQAYGSAAMSDMRVGVNEVEYHIFQMGIKASLAKRIDDFFTMYGYATNELAIPGFYNRKNYVYIKTDECIVHHKKKFDKYVHNGMNAEVEDILESIFNHGITLWNPAKEPGDYGDNPMAVLEAISATPAIASFNTRDYFELVFKDSAEEGATTYGKLSGYDAAISVSSETLTPGNNIITISYSGVTTQITIRK